MKLIHIIWNIIKNLLRVLFILIIYFLLIWTIKTWGFKNYFFYQNSRDWNDISSKIHLLEPSSLSNIFYSDDDIYEILKDYIQWNQKNLTGSVIDTWSAEQNYDDSLNVYDPEFEEDFNEWFGNLYSWNISTGQNVSTGEDFGFKQNPEN